MRKHIAIAACSMLVLASLATSASATPTNSDTVSFSGTMTDSCTVVASPGTLAVAADSLSLSTTESGGTAAGLSVSSVGTAPEVDFDAPQFDSATGPYAGTPTAAIKYSATGAASHTSYMTTSSVSQLTGNSASYVIDGKLSDSGGFVGGTYDMSVVATCGYGA